MPIREARKKRKKRKKLDPIDCCIVSFEVLMVAEVKLNTGKRRKLVIHLELL